MNNSEAQALAEANKHKPWARRWLRQHQEPIVPLSAKAVRMQKRAAQFVRGAKVT